MIITQIIVKIINIFLKMQIIDEKHIKIKNFIDFTNNNAIKAYKIDIPSREERNAR